MSSAYSECSPEPSHKHLHLAAIQIQSATVRSLRQRAFVNTMVAVNEARKRIDRERDVEALAGHGVRPNWLDGPRITGRPAAEGSCEPAGSIPAALDGPQSNVAREYLSQSPIMERQFPPRESPVAGARRGAGVSHIDITDQLRLDRDLLEGARQLESTFEVMRDGLAVCDTMGRIVLANSAFREMVALDRAPGTSAARRSEGAHLLDVRDDVPDMWGRQLTAMNMPIIPIRRALRGDVIAGKTAVDARVRAFDGRELDVRVSAAPIRDATGRVSRCIVVAHDLSEARLRAGAAQVAALSREVALRARGRDAVFEALPDGVLLYGPEGRLLRANAAARVLLGVDATGAGGVDTGLRQVAERFGDYAWYDDGRQPPPESWPPARVLRGETVDGTTNVDVTRRLPDGREQVLNVKVAPLYMDERQPAGVVVLLRDETERRRLQRGEDERAAQVEASFEAMADGLAVYDAAGRIVRMNAAHRRLLGAGRGAGAAEGPAGLTLKDRGQELVPHDTRGRPLPEQEWPLDRILRGETLSDHEAVDLQTHSSDGRVSEVSVSGAPMRDASGRIIGAVTSLRDVTAQRRTEAERAHMMSTVSHELKNPLNFMRLGLDLIRRSSERGEPAKLDTLELLDTGVSLMDRLVSDLVDAARMETGHLALRLARTDLAALARQVAREQMAVEDRFVIVEAPARMLHPAVDAGRIAQVLTNLLSNAFKYSPPDTPVRLRLYRKRREPYVEVHDEGPGIPPEARQHIFERFYRVPGVQVLHGAGVGLGLGLYICRGLVELHGGRIGVSSGAGPGSTLWFTLPMTRAGA